jgi:hypothetical protein
MGKLSGFAFAVLTVALCGCDIDLDEAAVGGRVQEDFHLAYDFNPGAKLVLENYRARNGWQR